MMEGNGKMGYTQQPIPKPTVREDLVKPEYGGSDMNYHETNAIVGDVVQPPFVPGHDPSRVVAEVGRYVTSR